MKSLKIVSNISMISIVPKIIHGSKNFIIVVLDSSMVLETASVRSTFFISLAVWALWKAFILRKVEHRLYKDQRIRL